MLDRIQGRVVRLAFDDVNTDVIAPNEFRAQLKENDHTLAALRPHVFRTIRPGLDGFVQPGDVFVVGKNFGAGSHREEAVRIFQVWGVQAVPLGGEKFAHLVQTAERPEPGAPAGLRWYLERQSAFWRFARRLNLSGSPGSPVLFASCAARLLTLTADRLRESPVA